MKDMKLTDKESKDYGLCCPSDSDDGPKYPYGLCLSLNETTMKKLGMETLPKVGGTVMVMAKANVVSVSQREERDGDKNSNVELQITEMDVVSGEAEDKADVLYKGM